MQIPAKIPGLRGATVLLGVYAAVWISLEGSLFRVVLMAWWVTAVSLAFLTQRYRGGRTLSTTRWLALVAGLGFFLGLGSGLLALFFMALKTGLHAHGPEFSPRQINWVVRQVPWWSGAGILAGLGFGLLVKSLRPR
jgi:hypothetical protein